MPPSCAKPAGKCRERELAKRRMPGCERVKGGVQVPGPFLRSLLPEDSFEVCCQHDAVAQGLYGHGHRGNSLDSFHESAMGREHCPFEFPSFGSVPTFLPAPVSS
jgi:hypothetical protein